LKAKYSVSEAEEKKAALNQLKNLKLEKYDNLEEYIDKFSNLKDLAGIKENTSLTEYLLKDLEMDLYRPVS
jgi:tRNA(Leu) C34 or U34 (ribose-2'-O)-methylase TrmL